ncbi:GNAT family N-acetyltransferase [Streptomyces armeniacus]|uniref:GNAT family N-acetyltransferase n=1 Tax=Streptomyces armeniacus TaxID=83291 RepID=UPI001AD84F2E|nr:GNAT family N-acetyltransferase [Streptomyces armeniacus]
MSTTTVPLAARDLDRFSCPPRVWRFRSGFRVALWSAPHRLDAESRRRIQEFIVSASSAVFKDADHSAYWEAKKDYFDKLSAFALIIAPDGELAGWGGYHSKRFARRRVLYLDAAGVLPRYQRYKLSSKLVSLFYVLERVRHAGRGAYLVLRTQNPAVHAGTTKILGPEKVFPQRAEPVPEAVRQIARETCDWLGQEHLLDPDTLIVRDAYKDVLTEVYGEQPTSGNRQADAYFGQSLGPHDAVVVVIKTGLAAVAAFAVREKFKALSAGWARDTKKKKSISRTTPISRST